jgi:hypothetical protein
MNNYHMLQKTIEIFLHSNVEIVFRDSPQYRTIKPHLPRTWQLAFDSDASVADIIKRVWGEVLLLFPDFCRMLQEQIEEVTLVITPETAYFAYIFQNEGEVSAFLGGLPAPSNAIKQCEEKLGLNLPQPYQKFLSVHNGFLLEGWTSVGIKALHELYTVGDLIGKDVSEHKIHLPYNPYKLLCFCGDGGGNERCFNYDHGADVINTIDWDHETRQLTNPISFEQFLMKFLNRELHL